MKKLILLLSLVSLTSVSANTLTHAQQNEVLTQIDNICGDTWCEGDFNFSFISLECSEKTQSCVLTAELNDDFDEHEELWVEASCEIEKGYYKYEQMLDHSRRWTSLNNDFYFAVSDCVTEMEEKVWAMQEANN